jgi:hypothetical protein
VVRISDDARDVDAQDASATALDIANGDSDELVIHARQRIQPCIRRRAANGCACASTRKNCDRIADEAVKRPKPRYVAPFSHTATAG